MAIRIIESYAVDTIEILTAGGNWRSEVRVKSIASTQLLKTAALKATFDTKELAEIAGIKAGQNLIEELKKSSAAL